MAKTWYRAECYSVAAPAVREEDTSSSVIYLRKDFKRVPANVKDGVEIPAHWEYDETTIPKEVASLLMSVEDLKAQSDDMTLALADIAGGRS